VSKASNVVIVIRRGTSLNKYIPGFEKYGELVEAHSVWGVMEEFAEKKIRALYFVDQLEKNCWGNYPS